jgi:hypothetical protein
MENYQKAGVIIGIVMIVVGLFSTVVIGGLGLWRAMVSLVGTILCIVVSTKHHKKVGITLIVIGVLGNIFLIAPGIMAIRYISKGDISRAKAGQGWD